MDRNFDFKIRDQLKKMKEFRDLSSDLRDAKLTSANGTTVTGVFAGFCGPNIIVYHWPCHINCCLKS